MDSSSAFAPAILQRWWRRENLLAGLALMAFAALGWAYLAYQTAYKGSMQSVAMGGMELGPIAEAALFLLAWTAMMVAMMVPATLPLILLYRTILLQSAQHYSARRPPRSGLCCSEICVGCR